MKRKHRFPPTTTSKYLPGVGRTITRANIAAFQRDRAENKEPPAEPGDIVAAFCRLQSTRDHAGTRRHLGRAYRLTRPTAPAVGESD